MKYKVSELEGSVLDAAMAEAEGLKWLIYDPQRNPLGSENCMVYLKDGPRDGSQGGGYPLPYAPSKDWCYAGPIIERERIDLVFSDAWRRTTPWACEAFFADSKYMAGHQAGKTILEAAMRSLVERKVGDEIELESA